MKKLFLSFFILFVASSVYSSPILINGDFEDGTYWDSSATPGSYVGVQNGRDLTALGPGRHWDVFENLPGWASFGAGIEVQQNTVVNAQSQNHYVELDSHGNNSNSGMFQDFMISQEGEYLLSFWYRPRTVNQNDNGIRAFILDTDSSVFANGVKTNDTDWEYYSLNLGVLDVQSYTLGFIAEGNDNTLGGFLDNIAINVVPVPEPATMVLFGMGLIGLAGLGRKKMFF